MLEGLGWTPQGIQMLLQFPLCNSRRVALVEEDASESEDLDDSEVLLHICTVGAERPQGCIEVDLQVNGRPLVMELNTGASVSIISQKTWQDSLQSPKLQPTRMRLRTYSGEALHLLGQCEVLVQYEDENVQLPLIVVEGSGPPLLGRNWLRKLHLNWGRIHKVHNAAKNLLHEYPELFESELGTIQGVTACLDVQEDATPRFFKPRYSLREAIEQDLERLERAGIVEKVRYSDWAAPIVLVPKEGGSIRLCGDFRVTVNPILKVDQYPVPTPEDLFATLAGGQSFTKLDLSHAYNQDPDSRKHVTINTHTLGCPLALPLPLPYSNRSCKQYCKVFPMLLCTSIIC